MNSLDLGLMLGGGWERKYDEEGTLQVIWPSMHSSGQAEASLPATSIEGGGWEGALMGSCPLKGRWSERDKPPGDSNGEHACLSWARSSSQGGYEGSRHGFFLHMKCPSYSTVAASWHIEGLKTQLSVCDVISWTNRNVYIIFSSWLFALGFILYGGFKYNFLV